MNLFQSRQAFVTTQRTTFLRWFFIICLLVALPVFIWAVLTQRIELRKQAGLTGPTLTIQPTTVTGPAGQTASLGIALDTQGASVSAAEVHLTYDPSIVEIDSFTPQSGTPVGLPVVLSPASIGSGAATITLGASPDSPFTGTAIIGDLEIKLLSSASAQITFANNSVVTVVDETTNALASTTGVGINGATPAPITFPGHGNSNQGQGANICNGQPNGTICDQVCTNSVPPHCSSGICQNNRCVFGSPSPPLWSTGTCKGVNDGTSCIRATSCHACVAGQPCSAIACSRLLGTCQNDQCVPRISSVTPIACQDVASALNGLAPIKVGSSTALNWGGLNEKWFQDANGQWYYIFLAKDPLVVGSQQGIAKNQIQPYVVMKWDSTTGLQQNGGLSRSDTLITMTTKSCYDAITLSYVFPPTAQNWCAGPNGSTCQYDGCNTCTTMSNGKAACTASKACMKTGICTNNLCQPAPNPSTTPTVIFLTQTGCIKSPAYNGDGCNGYRLITSLKPSNACYSYDQCGPAQGNGTCVQSPTYAGDSCNGYRVMPGISRSCYSLEECQAALTLIPTPTPHNWCAGPNNTQCQYDCNTCNSFGVCTRMKCPNQSGSCQNNLCTPAPSGCHYQVMECLQAPCPVQQVCPTSTPTPTVTPTPTPMVVCVRRAPTITINPSNQSGHPGDTLFYKILFTDTDSFECQPSEFSVTAQAGTGLTSSFTLATIPGVNPQNTPGQDMNITSTTSGFSESTIVPITVTVKNNDSGLLTSINTTYTVVPIQQNLTFKVKLAGVTGGQAEGAKINVKFSKQDGTTLQLSSPLTLTHVGNGVYQSTATLTNAFPPGTNYSVQIKGEKHAAITFTHQSGQTNQCSDSAYITEPNPVPQAMTFDFSGVPLPPGDTYTQDGVVNQTDVSRIITLMGKSTSALTAQDRLVGDLNYDGVINVSDLFQIYNTLQTRCD